MTLEVKEVGKTYQVVDSKTARPVDIRTPQGTLQTASYDNEEDAKSALDQLEDEALGAESPTQQGESTEESDDDFRERQNRERKERRR
jgi:hypothetical protein